MKIKHGDECIFFSIFTVALHNCFYLYSFSTEKWTFFFSFHTRNANPGLLYIWTMSALIFIFQTKQEGILINCFWVLTFIGIWVSSFVSCSVTIIFRNNNKGQREGLKVRWWWWWCFQTELLIKCMWGGCKWHAYLFLQPDAPSSTLPLLTELQVQSHLVVVWERGSCVLVLRDVGEPPQHCRVGCQLLHWGQVSSVGSFWYLWHLLWCSVILVQQKLAWSLLHGGWAQHLLSQSGTGSILVYPHSERIFKCISFLGLSGS